MSGGVPVSTIFIFSILFISSVCEAATDLNMSSTAPGEKSSWTLFQEKFRAGDVSELALPAFKGVNAVPNPDKTANDAANWYHIFWIDYEIAPHYRIQYWQRTFLLLSSYEASQG